MLWPGHWRGRPCCSRRHQIDQKARKIWVADDIGGSTATQTGPQQRFRGFQFALSRLLPRLASFMRLSFTRAVLLEIMNGTFSRSTTPEKSKNPKCTPRSESEARRRSSHIPLLQCQGKRIICLGSKTSRHTLASLGLRLYLEVLNKRRKAPKAKQRWKPR